MAELEGKYSKTIPKGEVLFREGDEGTVIYVVQKGSVRVSRFISGETRVMTDFGPGEFFGEMSLLNGSPRSGTAVVMDDAKLLCLELHVFEAMLRANTEIAVRMVKKLASRLASANQRMEFMLLRDAENRVCHALLSQGKAQGVKAEEAPTLSFDLAPFSARVAMTTMKVESVLERLEENGVLKLTASGLQVAKWSGLEEYAAKVHKKLRAQDGDAT